MKAISLPQGFRESRRGAVRLLARHGLLEPLVEAGALSGAPAGGWGERLCDVGGGRRPLLQIRLKGISEPLLVKRLRRGGWLAPVLRNLFLPRRALSEIAVVERLRARAVPTPPILAARLIGRFGYSGLVTVELITSRLEAARDLRSWLLDRPAPALRSAILGRAGAAVAAMHRAGVLHEDLNLGNLLVDAGGRVHLLDLGRSRISSPGAAGRAANLARLYRSGVKWKLVPQSLSSTDRARFLRGYAPDEWKVVHRLSARSFLRSLPFHRLSWWLSSRA